MRYVILLFLNYIMACTTLRGCQWIGSTFASLWQLQGKTRQDRSLTIIIEELIIWDPCNGWLMGIHPSKIFFQYFKHKLKSKKILTLWDPKATLTKDDIILNWIFPQQIELDKIYTQYLAYEIVATKTMDTIGFSNIFYYNFRQLLCKSLRLFHL